MVITKQSTRFSWFDGILIAVLLSFVAFIVYRLTYSLNYKWNWSIIPTYLVRFDSETDRWTANILLEGLFTTIRLSIWGMLLAAILGLFMGLARTARRLFFRLCSRTYVELIRNTPPLVLVFIFYFFVSDQILPVIGVDSFIRNLSAEGTFWITLVGARPDLFTPFLSGVITIGIFQIIDPLNSHGRLPFGLNAKRWIIKTSGVIDRAITPNFSWRKTSR